MLRGDRSPLTLASQPAVKPSWWSCTPPCIWEVESVDRLSFVRVGNTNTCLKECTHVRAGWSSISMVLRARGISFQYEFFYEFFYRKMDAPTPVLVADARGSPVCAGLQQLTLWSHEGVGADAEFLVLANLGDLGHLARTISGTDRVQRKRLTSSECQHTEKAFIVHRALRCRLQLANSICHNPIAVHTLQTYIL